MRLCASVREGLQTSSSFVSVISDNKSEKKGRREKRGRAGERKGRKEGRKDGRGSCEQGGNKNTLIGESEIPHSSDLIRVKSHNWRLIKK